MSKLVVSTNSKICREPNIFGVVHASLEKIGVILQKKTKNSSGNRRFTRFTGMAFSQPVERKRFFINRDYAGFRLFWRGVGYAV
jgi:hypothetical protein